MCDLLINAFKDILRLKYAPGEEGKAFQQRILNILQQRIHKENALIFNITKEPNGSQKFPDILLRGWKIEINIEVKRGSKGAIMWNEGFPKIGPNIYIFNGRSSSGRGKNKIIVNGTTIFLGQDVISKVEEEGLKNIHSEINEYGKKFTDIGKWKLSYIRPQYSEVSNIDKLYLLHPDRKKREENVFAFLNEA